MKTYSKGILAFGINDEAYGQIAEIAARHNLASYQISDETDLIAIPARAIVIDSNELSDSGYETFVEFYNEAKDFAEEVVIWFGCRILPDSIANALVCGNAERALILADKWCNLNAEESVK